MTEWWQNDRHLRINFFLQLQKHPHSSSFQSFLVIWECVECQGMKKYNVEITFKSHSSHFHLIPSSFYFQEWWWNDRMRGNEKIFLNQGKTLNSEIHLIPLSFLHSLSISYSSHDHSNHLRVIPSIWGSFLILMSFQLQSTSNSYPADTIQLASQKTLIRCCLLRGDSTWLNHSKIIPLSFQTHLK